MTFEEYLKSIEGLTADQVAAIIGGMADNKLFIASEDKLDDRYGKLKGQHDEATTKLTAAEELIKQLQPQAKGNEALQAKVTEYERAVADAEGRAAKAERDAAIKVELLANGAVPGDVDYLMYRIDSGDTKVEMGSDGKLSGLEDAVKSLKTSYPKNFADGDGNGMKVDPIKLPLGGGDGKNEPETIDQALKQHYDTN